MRGVGWGVNAFIKWQRWAKGGHFRGGEICGGGGGGVENTGPYYVSPAFVDQHWC